MLDRREMLGLGFAGAAALLASPSGAATEECAAAVRPHSELLDRYVAAVNAHSTDEFPALFTEAYIQHSGRSPSGLAAQIENVRGILGRMPDVQMKVADRIIAGDKVVARAEFHATHTQPLQGIAPTGRRFVLRTIDIWRVEDGKFAEHWDIVDVAGLQRQLGGE